MVCDVDITRGTGFLTISRYPSASLTLKSQMNDI